MSKETLEKRKSAIEILTEKIMEKQDGIMAILPSHTNPERFIKSALLVLSGSPALQECTVPSVVKCVYQAAELGLDFTPAKKLAYMVPFRNGKTGHREAQFMPGYKGLEQLAVNAKAAAKFSTQNVFQNETFSVHQGTNPSVVHVPVLTGDRGDIIGGYTISWRGDNTFQFTFMRKDELDKIRKRSKASDNGPWVTDTEEMYKKTIIRRHCKSLQLSPDKESDLFTKALEADNTVVGFDPDNTPQDTRSRTEQVRDLICGSDAEYEDIPKEEPETDKEKEEEVKPKPPKPRKKKEEPVKADTELPFDAEPKTTAASPNVPNDELGDKYGF